MTDEQAKPANDQPQTSAIPDTPNRPPAPTRVVITGIDISFFNFVELLIKISLAMIPAAIILTIIGVVFTSMFGGLTLFRGFR